MTESTSATQLAAGLWSADPTASTAGFIAHQLGREIPGTIPIRCATAHVGPTGQILDAHMELDLSSIDTGITKRDFDLAKPRLLDTARFPTLTVDVRSTSGSGQSRRARATLGIRGIAFAVDLEITVGEPDPGGDVRVLVTTPFDRTPIGIKAPGFVISKRVDVAVTSTFRRN